MHSYGIAIDLDPEHNPQGRSGGRIKDDADGVVALFEGAGWTGWRLNSRPDCMHFQRRGLKSKSSSSSSSTSSSSSVRRAQ